MSGPRVRELPLLDSGQARAGDRDAVDAGDSWRALMERAAGHLARAVVDAGGRGYGLRVAIVVGRGDNGGDGWAAARRLASDHGAQARVVAPDGTGTEVSEASAANRAAWLDAGGWCAEGTGRLAETLEWADVAVDALLGTGARGAPRGITADAVTALGAARRSGTVVVACDVPSGVDADDGSAAGPVVTAHRTVTFGALKRGLLLHPGAAHAGRVLLGDLGPAYRDPPTSWAALTPDGAAPEPYGPDTEKWARGVVLVLAGAAGTSGAAALAGTAALRSGAGLVTVGTPKSARIEVASRSDAGVMVRGLPAGGDGGLAPEAVRALDGLREIVNAHVVAAGPGLGRSAGAREVVEHLLEVAPLLVLDADALNLFREDPGSLARHSGMLVLTPHARELARIGGGESGEDAWRHRVERVPALARELDATILAKGPGTIVAAPDGRVWVCPVGGPALGSAGTGDVLTGVVAAAVAGAADVPEAVARAAWWHAAAGDRAGERASGRGTATDLLGLLPGVLADLGRLRSAPTGRPRPGELPWTAW